MTSIGKLRHLVGIVLVLILMGGYAAALSLPEIRQVAESAEQGDIVLQWAPGDYWAPPYDDNGVTRQVCTWAGQIATRSDGTTIWFEPNFWNIVSGDGENYMRFISSKDAVVFYVNMTNVETQYGGIAWATPNVVFAGRVPPSVSGGNELPAAGGYEWFKLPMPAKDRVNYTSILAKADFELAKGENTLVRPGFMMWFEDKSGNQLAEVYVPFFDDYNGIVGAQFPPVEVGSVTLTVYINGEPKNVTFTVQKAWNWNNFAFEFIPEEPLATSGEVVIDLRPVVDTVVEKIIDDPYSDYYEDDIVWSSLAFATYTGSAGNSFELGWILHDARVIKSPAVNATEEGTEEESEGKPSDIFKKFTMIGFYYYLNYQRNLNGYTALSEGIQTLDDNLTALVQTFKELGEEEYSKALEPSGGVIYSRLSNPRVFAHLRKAHMFMKAAREAAEYSIEYQTHLRKYESLIVEAEYGDIDPELVEKIEELRIQAENKYLEAISYPAGDLRAVEAIKTAYQLIKAATEVLEKNVVFSTKFKGIRNIASAKEPGDVQFTWWDQWLEEPIKLSDGRTVWMQTNFWNIVDGQGEVFMRFVKATEDFAFYVNLENVQTQWGGIAWATPEVIIDGRAPASWWGDKPAVGGYEYLQLPIPASELSSYDSIWVKVKYDIAKRDDTLVRFGINIWFEDPNTGAPIGEIYVPFFDDFGGIVGDKTEIGEVTSTVIVNGELKANAKFTVQRGLSGGGWGVLLFMPQEPLPQSAEVVIDIKPMIDKVIEQLSDFFGMPVENQQWTSISIGSYSGSEGTGFEYGWVIDYATVLSPSEAPKVIKVTQTVTETETITETVTETITETQTEKVTETVTVTETATESGGGICGPAFIVGLAVVPLLLRRRR